MPRPNPLISAAALAEVLAGPPAAATPPPVLLDVRWEIGKGPQHDAYLAGHIPGAVFVDLDLELAAPPGAGGRHPLPAAEAFQSTMGAAGISNSSTVVVYDAASSMAAARAWWLLRYFGVEDVSVLDGGLATWVAVGGELETGQAEVPLVGTFVARPGAMPLLDAAGAAALAERGLLLDARAPERFRGEQEPVDPIAGHIPGARNRPTAENVVNSGKFSSPEELREAFNRVGAREGVEVGAYCGSGVTAAHEVLALERAGIPAALYIGSWSDWIADPRRPVATGD